GQQVAWRQDRIGRRRSGNPSPRERTERTELMSTISFDVPPEVLDNRESERALRVRGGRSLRGEISVRGAKNTLPKNMVASLLTDQECVLRNVAGVSDVEIVGRMVRALGGEVEHTGSGEIRMCAARLAPLSRGEAAEFSGRSPTP